jgi:hypothetical protein
MEIEMFLRTATGQFGPICYWLMVSFPGFFIIPSQLECLPSGYLCYLGISRRLSNTFNQLLPIEAVLYPSGISQ